MTEPFFISTNHWSPDHPKSLVICCSDGRLQKSTDEFLQNHLGIFYYDKLYAPGGPFDGVCAHYRRLMPGGTNAEVASRQETDKADVLHYLAAFAPGLEIQTFHAEVLPALRIQFVELG